MTGGSVSRSAGILSRANELERLNKQKDGLAADLKTAFDELAKTQRELTAAQYELDAAAGQLREAEDAVLKWSERADSASVQLADLELRRQILAGDRAQVRRRMEENTANTAQAKARIEELEGSAAALRSEGEAKAQGRTALRDKMSALSEESARHSAKLAGLEGEQSALSQSIGELERLRDDLSGDTANRTAMIGQFEQQNDYLLRRIQEEEERLQRLRAASQEGTAAIRRLNDEKLALEGRRNQADRQARDKNNELNNMEREVANLENKASAAAVEECQLLDKLWESYELSHEAARAERVELESVPKAQRRIGELKRSISALGSINPDAVEEFARVNERYTYFTGQRDDVAKAKKELQDIIAQITGEMTAIFKEQFALIDQEFRKAFAELFGGGKAELILDDPEDVLGCGIEIRAQPPGKTIQHMSSLSGGERALIAIALYFAILKVRPTPFCVMDEIEAALDESNVVRYARYMRRMSGKTQFIVITHRRGTMEEADVLYGVTMQEKGVSRMLTIDLNDVEKELDIK